MLFGPGEHGVLAADVDDVAAHPLGAHHPGGLRDTRNEPRAMTSCCRSQSATVVSSSGLEMDRPALLTTRSTPPNASAAASNAAAIAASSVTSAGTAIATSGPADAPAAASASAGVPVGDDDARALGRQPVRDRPADAGAAAGDQRDPAWPAAWAGQPAQLGLLQRPVLDPELLRLVDRARTWRAPPRRASR